MKPSSAAESFKIEREGRGTTTVAKLVGSACMMASEELKEQLLELVEPPCRLLVLDLSKLEFISSEGLGGIIAAHLRCRRHQGSVVLVKPCGDIFDLLAVTNLDSLFPIYDTVEQAMQHASNHKPA